jgi:general secretion pathway protein A
MLSFGALYNHVDPMYYSYFGLKTAPFSIAPNPEYLLMTERHQEALAHLYHGIGSDAGFVLLTGDVGTGKTTVCRQFLNHLPEQTQIVFILNPCLDSLELLQAICQELAITGVDNHASLRQLSDSIYQDLLAKHAKGINTVLLIDEAQQMHKTVLEHIRLLTNLETDTQKLLKIILVGQPELNQVLAQPDLVQLSQRITARYHIKPLVASELGAYIDYRLQAAGYSAGTKLFPASIVKQLFAMSAGVPRVINVICDRALLGVYSQSGTVVTKAVLRNAYREVKGNYIAPKEKPSTIRRIVFVLGLLVAMTVVAVFWQSATGTR